MICVFKDFVVIIRLVGFTAKKNTTKLQKIVKLDFIFNFI